jgi:hypothetical protein
MPPKATFEQRIKWHKAHSKHCSCRPIPPLIEAAIRLEENKRRSSNEKLK